MTSLSFRAVRAIRGAVFEVYLEMGIGFLEPVYQERLEMEFTRRAVSFLAQSKLRLTYKNEPLLQVYKPDFICFGTILVELKAVKELAPERKGTSAQLPEIDQTEARTARELRRIRQGGD